MREGGHIVNVGSWSSETREPGGEPYVAAKAGIRAFSDTLRKSLKARQIRVTLIEPGAVGSDFSEAQPAEQRELHKRGEMLKAEDIAAGIAFSPGAACALHGLDDSDAPAAGGLSNT